MVSNTIYECEEDGTEELNIEITQIYESGPQTPVINADLEDHTKRWLIIGIGIHSVLSPTLRKYIEPVVSNLYNSLQQMHGIQTQTYPKQLKKCPTSKRELDYEAINNNSLIPRVRRKPDVNLVKPALGYLSGIPPTHGACRLKSLAKPPVSIYLPDGSVPNFIYNVSQTGCWFSFDKCPNHPAYEKTKRPLSMPYYRDMNAEMKDNSGTDKTICLNKVSEMISKCGNGSSFAVIFGPTGAMTLGGDGCYFATYGCPRVKSMASGFIRDAWAEQHVNGAHEESACLSRALPQWRYCGSNPAFPLASIYKPTGHIKVAGAGCWIKAQKCPADNSLKHMFYDSFGATYLLTDDDIESCFSRAEYFWRKCGSHPEYKVTAYFRPAGKSQSFP